jgi:hypothetical protein
VVTRIGWDGTMRRRVVDTAQRGDGPQWEDLAARAVAVLPPYRPVPCVPIYHVSVGDTVVQAAEHDLTGALLDLITAVLALGEELLPALLATGTFRRPVRLALPGEARPGSCRRPDRRGPSGRGFLDRAC